MKKQWAFGSPRYALVGFCLSLEFGIWMWPTRSVFIVCPLGGYLGTAQWSGTTQSVYMRKDETDLSTVQLFIVMYLEPWHSNQCQFKIVYLNTFSNDRSERLC